MFYIEEDEVEVSCVLLMEYFVELCQCLLLVIVFLVVGFIGCFVFFMILYEWLLVLYQEVVVVICGVLVEEFDLMVNFFVFLEFFFVWFKLLFVGVIMVIFLIIVWQIYEFVVLGLYKNEKGVFVFFLVLLLILFGLGVVFVYFIVLLMVMCFLLGQEQVGGDSGFLIEFLLNVLDYMNLIIMLMLVFGIFFQMLILMMLLVKVGIVCFIMMFNGWCFVVVGIVLFVVFVMLFDLIFQILFGSVFLVFYFFLIGVMKFMEFKFEDEEEILFDS